ncbi:GNAT family N-acetyltransferase [uncultured Alteromonas sp.]|jgi:putative acetyltransferase|uniref:GNAT family N-acetyltransferase n=1 Tax=uncultured Alteromonas sp. TaxID=179113 RepID=UPI0030CBCA23|tara:strand:- start:24362 stop:24853 length:492 start_codon:yes stop_codon:yes gene_type:complete
MKIKHDDLSSGDVIALLEEHLKDMYATSPPESVHALDVTALKPPNITFFSAWQSDVLAGCVAIRKLSSTEAELKSMRTVAALRNKGVATQLLTYVIEFAIANGYQTLSLETGTQGYFNAARQLYAKNGFKDCEPFGNYQLNPNSHFMTKPLVNIDISPSSPPK